MRTENEYLLEYAKSHQNPLNQIIHMICVPTIFAATLAIMWVVPVGRFIPGVPADLAPWINLGTLFMIPAGVFYLMLSPRALLIGSIWTALSVLLILGVQASGLSLLWTAITVWIIAWVAQFYGHHVEGAKPSFADDLLFLLIGPLYVQEKLNRLVRTGSIRPRLQ